jgi:hypothetical protein
MLPPHRGGPASGSATPRGRSQAVGGAAPYRGGQVAGGAAPCRGLEVRGSGSIGSSRRGRKVVPGSGEEKFAIIRLQTVCFAIIGLQTLTSLK